MRYFLRSILTRSFWQHALLSKEGFATLFAAVGGLYTFLEILDFFSIYTKDHYSRYAIFPIFVASVLFVIFSRRPLARFSYKLPGRDIRIDVKVGDICNEQGDLIISSNSTFDTDIASGLISSGSIQGQLTARVFDGNVSEIDRQLSLDLEKVEHCERAGAPGKPREYPIGTVARVQIPQRVFYFVAMSRLNDHGTSQSSVRMVEDALQSLWSFVRGHGQLQTIVIPVIGTGRGRVEWPRKKMIERIAQSFVDASSERIFSNKLVVMIRPEDAENFGVNLFEIKDYLARSLHY